MTQSRKPVINMAVMIHTKFGYISPTEAKCDGELNKYFNERNKVAKRDKNKPQRKHIGKVVKTKWKGARLVLKELESRIQNALMFDDHDNSIF